MPEKRSRFKLRRRHPPPTVIGGRQSRLSIGRIRGVATPGVAMAGRAIMGHRDGFTTEDTETTEEFTEEA